MEREWLVSILVVVLGGLTVQALSWLRPIDSSGMDGGELERRAWLRLWYPVAPALLVPAWLCGWALTESDPVRDRLGAWVLYAAWAPFAVILARAALRAVWALLRSAADRGVATVGLIQPRTVFSPFLAKQLEDVEIRAALAHEQAHVRHRDPLRVWLAQLVSDLQWPWPTARLRLETWLVALELARDEEARESGADGADIAAAVLASIRYLHRLPSETQAPFTGTPFTHACLVGDAHRLRERVSRLLAPLPQPARGDATRFLSFETTACLFVAVLLVAVMLGIDYGERVMHSLLALTS
jgi:BlaR1 peptidase M56